MENGWNLFNFSNSSTNFGKVHNSLNCPNTTAAWEDVSESGTASAPAAAAATTTINTTSRLIINSHHSFLSSQQSLMLADDEGSRRHHHHHNYINNYFPDPHLMCLKLGKRHYYGDAIAAGSGADVANYSIATKKGKPDYHYYDHDDGDAAAGCGGILVDDDGDHGDGDAQRSSMSMNVASSTVPRCQVDGCHSVLLNAKDYHRRHKVCEIHSKAPKVLVLGLEQRFCQQCSRFHAVSEFDESKRSCRRRLAGHNERRRKSSQQQQLQQHQHSIHSQGRHAYLPLNSECALSLLSSKNDSWISATDLPARCSAALGELIAENRAAILARQLVLDKDWQWQYYYHQPLPAAAVDQEMMINGRQQIGGLLLNNNNNNYQQQIPGSNNWERMSGEAADGHVTLDLMQAPNSAFGFLSAVRGKSKEDDDQKCPELWGTTSFGGTHVLN